MGVQGISQTGDALLTINHPKDAVTPRGVDSQRSQRYLFLGGVTNPKQEAANRIALNNTVKKSDHILHAPAKVTVKMRNTDITSPGLLDNVFSIVGNRA